MKHLRRSAQIAAGADKYPAHAAQEHPRLPLPERGCDVTPRPSAFRSCVVSRRVPGPWSARVCQPRDPQQTAARPRVIPAAPPPGPSCGRAAWRLPRGGSHPPVRAHLGAGIPPPAALGEDLRIPRDLALIDVAGRISEGIAGQRGDLYIHWSQYRLVGARTGTCPHLPQAACPGPGPARAVVPGSMEVMLAAEGPGKTSLRRGGA
jgi:hypothetical protein